MAVGLKPKKGPISVYIAEVMHIGEEECGLKYMKKTGDTYIWPEPVDMSVELTTNIINPSLINERGHFKFNASVIIKLKGIW